MRAQFSNAGSAFDLSADSFDEEGDDHRPARIVRQPSQRAPMARSGSFRSEIPLQRGTSIKFRDLSMNDVEEDETFVPPPMSRQPSTRVPLFRSGSFNKPPPLVRENSLLGDVRTRLHKLIADQQMEELETRFTQEQQRMERLLLQAEIQKVVTKKVKELNTIEESQSISSKITSRSRGIRTAGQDTAYRSNGHSPNTHPIMHRAFTTGSAVHAERAHHYRGSSKSPPTIRQGAGSPSLGKHGTISPSSQRSKSPPVAHVTFPSAHVSSLSSAEKFNKTHAGDNVYHNHHKHCTYEDEDPDLQDDISDLGSQCSQESLGSLSTNKRHALIIIRKTDINHGEIRAIVNKKFASPEKWAIDEQYVSPAFPALLRTSPKKPLGTAATAQKETPEKYSANGAPMSFRSVVSAVSSKNNAMSGKSGENSTFSSTKSATVSEKADTLGTMYSSKVDKAGANSDSAKRPTPAPFMKTKSSSSIMLTQVAPAPLTPAETGGVPVVPVRRLSVANIRTKGATGSPLRSSIRSSQLFSLNASDAYLGELQSEDILASHFRGWSAAEHTLSAKNNTSHTNFY